MAKETQKDKIARLEKENEELRTQLEELQKLINEKHNERGAGRKEKFTERKKNNIRKLYQDGMKMSDIAKKYKCSVGLVHKLINENKDSE